MPPEPLAHPLRFGLSIRPQEFPIGVLRQMWRDADDYGFDHIWAFDHLDSIGTYDHAPVFDAWTLLGAAAEVTRRAGLGVLVTGNLYRHPASLAKIAVTVDHLSGGRLEMGLGAGRSQNEFDMMGIPFPCPNERIERLDEACSVLRLLWTEPRANFSGRHYQLTEAVAEPKPLRRPHPPLWVGGSGHKRTLRVVATHADVWNAPDLSLAANIASSKLLDEHCAAVRRDPSTIRRSAQIRWGAAPETPPPRTLGDLAAEADITCRTAEAYIAAGFTELVFMIGYGSGPDVRTITDAISRHVLPRMRMLGD